MDVKSKSKFINVLTEGTCIKPLEAVLQFLTPLNYLNLIRITKIIRVRVFNFPMTNVNLIFLSLLVNHEHLEDTEAS